MNIYHNEWDKNACNVLRNHFPNSFVDERSIADVTIEEIKDYKQCHFFAGIGGFSVAFERYAPDVNVWTGGFPCQDLSIAGKRAGLAGSRSGFYFTVHKLIVSGLPRWVVLENVPGLLSSNKGRDFAIVVGGLTGIIPDVPENGWGNAGLFRGPVYQVAYRILDAQFFGVPQRRRRVFIVASFGNGRAAEVLFESQSVSGDTPPSRKAGEGVAYSLRANPSHSGDKGDGGINTTMIASTGWDTQRMRIHDSSGVSPTLAGSDGKGGQRTPIVFDRQRSDEYGEADTVSTVSARDYKSATDLVAYNIQHNDGGAHKRKDRPNGGLYVNETETALTVGTSDMTAVAWTVRGGKEGGGKGYLGSQDMGMTIGGQPQYIGVRRLTPTECERLQGFPDGWTDGQSDTQRYKQLGNAVAVPVVEWIARRIAEVEAQAGGDY